MPNKAFHLLLPSEWNKEGILNASKTGTQYIFAFKQIYIYEHIPKKVFLKMSCVCF